MVSVSLPECVTGGVGWPALSGLLGVVRGPAPLPSSAHSTPPHTLLHLLLLPGLLGLTFKIKILGQTSPSPLSHSSDTAADTSDNLPRHTRTVWK